MKTVTYEFRNLDCEKCAARLQRKISEIEGIHDVKVEYPSCICTYACDEDRAEEIEAKMKEIVREEEPEVEVIGSDYEHDHCECHHHDHELNHEHHHCHDHEEDHCDCHHDHDHHETAVYMYEVKDIDCADCAAKLEEKIAKIKGIENVSLSFMNSSLSFECDHDAADEIRASVEALIAKEEPDAKVTYKGHKHQHAHDEHEHNHEHHPLKEGDVTVLMEVKDIDCADCAAKLEDKISKLEGITNVSLSFMNSSLRFDTAQKEREQKISEVISLIEKEEPDAKVSLSLNTKEYRFQIANIDCADCADKLARKAMEINGVVSADADFMHETLIVNCEAKEVSRIETELKEMIHREEPEVVFSRLTPAKKKNEEKEEDKTMLYRLIIGALLFVVSLFLKEMPQIAVSLLAWLVLGYDVLLKAVRGIGRGQLFDEHFLMSVATIAAIYLQDYREAAGVMLFYQIGEYFQDLAVHRSRRYIGELMDIRPDYAMVKRNGEYVQCEPDEVSIGEVIRVKPGELIPLDGVIVSGSSSLDTSSLTGESRPLDVDTGDEVQSGSVNESGVIEIRVTKEYGESTVSKILELVENSESRKASHEKFITKFSRYYTPIVVFSAIAVALAVGIFMQDFNEGIRRACTFLVISCPCALVISIPLSFFAGIGGLSSRGILVKGANIIDTLAKVKQVVMDKTGTLTGGTFAVDEIIAENNAEDVLKDAAYAEMHSNHPIALGILDSYGKKIDEHEISEVKEIAGRGVSVTVNNDVILAGNAKLLEDHDIAFTPVTRAGTLVYVAKNNVYEGCLILKDQMKQDAAGAVAKLQKAGIGCAVVSGDNQEICSEIAQKLNISQVYGECLPEDKVRIVSELKNQNTTAFVGDGVNDAPVLVSADIGMAMGALGSDAAIEAADVVIMDDSLDKISLAIESAGRILRVANENIFGAIFVKILVLILGAFGIANMWMAIFADTGVALLCVINSMRLLYIARRKENA